MQYRGLGAGRIDLLEAEDFGRYMRVFILSNRLRVLI